MKSALGIVKKIAETAAEKGGRAYFVGGCVRDFLQGVQGGDYDVEIHGVDVKTLEEILKKEATIKTVGAEFGIYSLAEYPVDIALPRREIAIGKGHCDFKVETNPFMGVKEAAKRRDFTVNAILQDVLTGEIVDPYGGVDDIKKGVLRHISSGRFDEDPLRVFRAAQFAARLGFQLAEETELLCKGMRVDTLAGGRVCDELKKALLKAEDPSRFFEVLRRVDHLKEFFPELANLMGVEQNEKYHAEGDVWTHTLMVLRAAAKRRGVVRNPFGFMLSALTHDFGKSVCTERANGVIHSYEHERKGLPLVENFLRRLTGEKNLIAYVLNMVELHMKPNVLARNNAPIKSTNKLFDCAVEPFDLIQLSAADNLGKISPYIHQGSESFLMERLHHFQEWMERPFVTGKDLLEAGLPAGEYFGELLSYAHKLRLAEIEKESVLKQTIAYARKLKK